MEVFAWNPAANAETLEAFNQRLEDYCIANPVLQVVPSVVGVVLALSLTEAADAEVATLNCLVPVVIWVPNEDLMTAEASLGKGLAAIKARDTDEEPFTPFQMTLYQAGLAGAYAVVLVNAGELDLGEEGEGEGDAGDAGDPNAGAIPPALRGGRNR